MSEMVYVGIGSNVEADRNVQLALAEMQSAFGTLVISPVYQSAAVGFIGDDFLNLVVGFESTQSVLEVVDDLRQLEDKLGRDRTQPRFSKRPIDLDIILFGDLICDEAGVQVPRHEILHSAFVLKPLCDLIPEVLHPIEKQSFYQLWQGMVTQVDRLDRVEL